MLLYLNILVNYIVYLLFFHLILNLPPVSFPLCSSSVRVMPCTFPHCSLATRTDPCACWCRIALLVSQQSQTFFPSTHTCDVPCLCSRLSYPRHSFLNQSAHKASLSLIKTKRLEEEQAIVCLCHGACTGVTSLPNHRQKKREKEEQEVEIKSR